MAEKDIIAFFHHKKHEHTLMKQRSCLLPISVGQSYHEGTELVATIDLVNRKFGYCYILICDTLQRYTLAVSSNQSLSSIETKALQQGTLWKSRNITNLKFISIPNKILHWNDLRDSPFAKKFSTQIEEFYNQNSSFMNSVHMLADKHVNKILHKAHPAIHPNTIKQHCIDYIKEECAILLQLATKNINYELYPGNRNPAMNLAYHEFIKTNYNHATIMTYLNLHFKKTKLTVPTKVLAET